MPRARNQTEQLGARKHEIEDLRKEEQEEGLREMCLDAYNGEGHACNITKRVTGEGSGRVPTRRSAFHRAYGNSKAKK